MQDKKLLNLRGIRLKRGITQVELAMLMDISSSLISSYENGLAQPTPSRIRKFARVLGVQPKELYIVFVNGRDLTAADGVESINQADTLTNQRKPTLPGFNIATIMEQRGISQKELSNLTGIDRSLISRYVNNMVIPSDKRLELIATALQVPIQALWRKETDDINEMVKQENDPEIAKSVQAIENILIIKNVRKSKGITQEELGRRTGLSRNLISRYENNKVSATSKHIATIAEALEVPVQSLYGTSVSYEVCEVHPDNSCCNLVESSTEVDLANTHVFVTIEKQNTMKGLKLIRRTRGFTQKKLEEITGIHRTVISKLENGFLSASDKYIAVLSNILAVKGEDLCSENPNLTVLTEQTLVQQNKLLVRRQIAGVTQAQLAERAGISLQLICKYENGHRDINSAEGRVLLAMAKALNCHIEDLLDEGLNN